MKFSQEFIEKVREANNIVELISQHTQLKGVGAQLTGLCPFPDHNEKTASFSVSESKQVYFCFGCRKSGNIYTFIQALQGLSFPEAVEYLAQRAHIPIPEEAKEQRPNVDLKDERNKKNLMWKINRYAAQFYHQQLMRLPEDHEVKSYLKNRGITEELAKKFRLGYAPNEWEALSSTLRKNNIPLQLAEELGLLKRRTGGHTGHYDLFRHRLMFPIVSHTSQFIGFGGRVLGDDQPKYLNSHESMVFHKGRVFYGLDETAKFIRTQDEAIVVEGYTDFLALYKAGFCNVVATLGTALTRDHARLLKRYTKNVIVLFDGDAAGQSAAERSLPLLLAEGLLPRALALPEKMDPDEYLAKHGVDELKKQLSEAPELFQMILRQKLDGYSGAPAEKVSILDKMAPYLLAVEDLRLRDLYLQEVAEMLALEVKWVRGAIKQSGQNQKPAAHEAPTAPPPAPSETNMAPVDRAQQANIIKVSSNPKKAELFLLNIALMKEEYFKEIQESKIVDFFESPELRQIFARAEEYYGQMPSEFDKLTALLVSQVDPSELVSLHLDKALSVLTVEGARKLIADCRKKIRDAHLRSQAKQQLAHLKGRKASEQLEQLEQIMNIHKDRHSLNRENDPS